MVIGILEPLAHFVLPSPLIGYGASCGVHPPSLSQLTKLFHRLPVPGIQFLIPQIRTWLAIKSMSFPGRYQVVCPQFFNGADGHL